ncbi:MAG: response regulator [Planctomycetota bacterium]|nr:response regulator [Planctomycetota bacterium]
MKTVVVIDDEFGLAEAITALLEDEGYRAVMATNGRQGLELVAEHAPDLVLLAFMMPLLGGPEVLAAIRARDPRHPPVIVMSAAARDEVRAACPGAAAYLTKPFSGGALLAAIRAALDRPG